MNAFARAEGEVVLAFAADLEVLVEFLVEDHRRALRTFGPQTLRDVALLFLRAGELGFLGERSAARVHGRLRERGFSAVSAKRFFIEDGGGHTDGKCRFCT